MLAVHVVGFALDAGGGNGSAAAVEAEVAGAGEGEVSGHILKGMGVHAEFVVGIGGIGGAGEAAFGGRGRDPHQSVRILEGQWAQEDGVDDAEDGDVGADAQGENEHGNDGESAVAAEVLEKNVEFHKSSGFALLEFCGVDGAETNERLAACFKGSEAALDVFFNRKVDVGGDLRFEVGVERRLAEKRKDAPESLPQRARRTCGHQAPSS